VTPRPFNDFSVSPRLDAGGFMLKGHCPATGWHEICYSENSVFLNSLIPLLWPSNHGLPQGVEPVILAKAAFDIVNNNPGTAEAVVQTMVNSLTSCLLGCDASGQQFHMLLERAYNQYLQIMGNLQHA
jgi:hypothetical protein